MSQKRTEVRGVHLVVAMDREVEEVTEEGEVVVEAEVRVEVSGQEAEVEGDEDPKKSREQCQAAVMIDR